jgi:hypothetical protein
MSGLSSQWVIDRPSQGVYLVAGEDRRGYIAIGLGSDIVSIIGTIHVALLCGGLTVALGG